MSIAQLLIAVALWCPSSAGQGTLNNDCLMKVTNCIKETGFILDNTKIIECFQKVKQ